MDALHQKLLDPSAYPDPTTEIAFRETHISRIYLTDTRAYKLKKPLNLGFLDFSTLEKRHFYCHEEVRLNRRFAPKVYLGVSELREERNRLHFGGDGRLIDYAVCMQRLPEECMLDRMIDADDQSLMARMPDLASTLHYVFARAEPCRHGQPGHLDTVRRNCRDNFEQTRSAIGSGLTRDAHRAMESWTERQMEALADLFAAREQTGFVRDGHGDLHTGNICMTNPILIYDCIEFNRLFRVGDIVADLAFLLMDLEFRDRRDLALRLLADYRKLADDPDLNTLLTFYKVYRAWVRAKVDTILAGEVDASPQARSAALELSRRYFNLALGSPLSATLFMTCGLMGTGKTLLARALAHATGAKLLRSDVIRKQMAEWPETSRRHDPFGKGLYRPEMTEKTYTALLDDAITTIKGNRSVVVDASFSDENERQRFLQKASDEGCPAWILHLRCPDKLAIERLSQRRNDASDGRRELFADQKQSFSPILSLLQVISVDSEQDVDYNVQSILCRALCAQERLL